MTPSLHDDREGGLGRTEFEDEFEFENEFENEPLVRPFMVTGGRTHTSLPIEAMVVDTQGRGAVLPPGDEYRVLYRLCAEPQAVAELSARAAMPLGVVRVLVGDLVATGALVMAEPGLGGDDELDFIDSIILAIEHM